MQNSSEATANKPGRGFYLGGALLVLIAAVLAFYISASKESGKEAESKQLQQEIALGPHVRVAEVKHTPSLDSLTLEGEARPYQTVTLYAKVSGYLKQIKVDKGDNVREGQVIAVIESPETDRAYQAALADAANKKRRAERNKELLDKQLLSAQDAEQSVADAEVAAQNLGSLETQKGYETLRAPFSGKVTARYADRGALMQNAANSQTSALPIVTVSQVDRLRIYVYLDQAAAGFVHEGAPVTITVPERPGFSTEAKVTRFSGALDAKTRMLLVEIEVPNAKGLILAGSTVQVTLSVHKPELLVVPSAALLVRKAKYYVPLLSQDDRVHFTEIKLASNDGEFVEVLSGLKEGDRVALNLGDQIADSSHVQLVKPTPPK